ncbi:Ltp family lipoprotein [Subtercola boreus]|uniref:Putative host cell surface-exposed lipoprotein Ltp-like HTH region domain-containing protein n=1 Tax=Subtercola boreus TaxID=120213 RepID=A0A3E0WFC7_9MICO|nr:Ltp family lipoprotein [Subtercola boreus]RFA22131.1 hypothetical protein B7R24_05495 [Subtercola boreus]RFA22311.1 hypothetical protein B7R23_05440 [Subtercola boreus]RFA28174.1 hypothetical protein B7R25_05565 [Subtercola boreus]
MGLALAALIVGIAAFLFGLIPVFGAVVGIAAIVLGVFALRKGQSKVLAIVGIALGSIATITSIVVTIGVGAAVNSASVDEPVSIVAESATPTNQAYSAPQPVETAQAAPTSAPVETAAPIETQAPAAQAPAPAAPAAPDVSAEYKSALRSATNYSEILHLSKARLYDQLTSEYGEKFSAEAAQYAVDNVQADWNANALATAKNYQNEMSMSPEGIRDQLTSEYGEKFTADEADYAITHLND